MPADSRRANVDWPAIDTVLLDMDGTLLDLRFDNYFWQELVPARYARHHAMPLDAALAVLNPRFTAKQGTLDWYCTDYWTRELGFDIADLKHEVRERVAFLPGAEAFLGALQGSGGRQVVLVTNAHRDSLAVKTRQTELIRYFDVVVSSHDFGVPKEHPQFWPALQAQLGFDRQRTLFVDDSLAVLRAARQYGIAQIVAISHPDTGIAQRSIGEFPAVTTIADLLPL